MSATPIAANDNVRQFYVYQHRRNDTGEVFYVGKGAGDRAWEKDSRSRYWRNIVNKHGHTVEILCDEVDEDFSFLLERELIAKIGRRDKKLGPLVNLTDGGEGASGLVMSAEARAKVSKSRRGIKHSDEHREKNRLAHLGRTHSQEARARIGDASRGRVVGPNERARRSLSQLGRPKSAEHRANSRLNRVMRGPKPGTESGFKGVRRPVSSQNWYAKIKTDKQYHLGVFSTPEEAARAYDAAAVAAWGAGNCYLNFPAEHGLAA